MGSIWRTSTQNIYADPNLAFDGSRKKAAVLKTKLTLEGHQDSKLNAIQAPAGHDLGAITPDEIALSILASLIAENRRSQRVSIKYRQAVLF